MARARSNDPSPALANIPSSSAPMPGVGASFLGRFMGHDRRRRHHRHPELPNHWGIAQLLVSQGVDDLSRLWHWPSRRCCERDLKIARPRRTYRRITQVHSLTPSKFARWRLGQSPILHSLSSLRYPFARSGLLAAPGLIAPGRCRPSCSPRLASRYSPRPNGRLSRRPCTHWSELPPAQTVPGKTRPHCSRSGLPAACQAL